MREVAFIKQNKQKWLDSEESLNRNENRDPDEIASAYIQLLNDLSYAQTYYPKSKTVDYLNFSVSQIYRKIYKTKRLERNRFLEFFVTDVPLLVYQYRKQVLFAFSIFFFFTMIGAISAKYDPDFIRLILGDRYVNMTLENIKKGDPMAVYKQAGGYEMFLGITINNIMVAAKAYIYGITGGFLTFYMAFKNAIMLGSFQSFFYEKGLLEASLRAVWLHGAMEIFSIIIATAAGFVLAASMLFPRTFSRKDSFKQGVKDSMKIFLSVTPFFVFAGFIEGFITRYSNTMPVWLNSLIIFGTLAFISFYYLAYPFWVNRNAKKNSVFRRR